MLSRFAKAFLAVTVLLLITATTTFFHQPSRSYIDLQTGQLFGDGGVEKPSHPPSTAKVPGNEILGGVIMGKLGNATAKAELGRASWKLLHTMTLRYPERPTQDERDALHSFIHLTSRLYPCGECAAEFQGLLKRYPPQTSSRRSAALWLCFIHNQVNERLGKPVFDCADLDGTYDCGCGDSPVMPEGAATATNTLDPKEHGLDPGRDSITGADLIKGGR